jgi:hypothetical protein
VGDRFVGFVHRGRPGSDDLFGGLPGSEPEREVDVRPAILGATRCGADKACGDDPRVASSRFEQDVTQLGSLGAGEHSWQPTNLAAFVRPSRRSRERSVHDRTSARHRTVTSAVITVVSNMSIALSK